MSDSNIQVIDNIKKVNKMNTTKSTIITFFLIIFVAILIVIANFIGPHFLNVFLFSLLFGFPLLILYREQIAKQLPENIASYLVGTQEEINADVQEALKIHSNPLYAREVQIFILGIISLIVAIQTLRQRHKEFTGILTSLFFTILAMIFMNDLF